MQHAHYRKEHAALVTSITALAASRPYGNSGAHTLDLERRVWAAIGALGENRESSVRMPDELRNHVAQLLMG
jgi:hypothetical protein